jgi:hypothetical protein
LFELRYTFKVPVDVLVELTRVKAERMLSKMKEERAAGRLEDVKARPASTLAQKDLLATLSDASPSKRSAVVVYEESPSKKSK